MDPVGIGSWFDCPVFGQHDYRYIGYCIIDLCRYFYFDQYSRHLSALFTARDFHPEERKDSHMIV